MTELTAFVQEHLNDDVTRLILDRSRWQGIDIELAAACIESRKKLKNKVQEWYANPELVFPIRLSAEQCSSTPTGHYKAEIAARIADKDDFRIADLTGGLGVDSWFFSKKASEVLYNEMQEKLCKAARHNFASLRCPNIQVSNATASVETIDGILSPFKPDIVYLDPARRSESGKKVFLIEECTPDILLLKDKIFSNCRHILLKLSPMADISMVCSRLGSSCREVHVIATGGECKELLVWMDKEWNDEYSISAVELPAAYPSSSPGIFTFRMSEEKAGNSELYVPMPQEGAFLFEPGKALMKSGCFNLICKTMGVRKIGRSTHFYITEDYQQAQRLKDFGKIYNILTCSPLNKHVLKETGKLYPHSEVTARNIPMDTDTLRKKIGATSGDDAHIFGLKSDHQGNILLVTEPL